MTQPELLRVTTTGFQTLGDRAVCLDPHCTEQWATSHTSRLLAVQHARTTGHTVRVVRQTFEDIKPYEDGGG